MKNIDKNLETNIGIIEARFSDSGDFVSRRLSSGGRGVYVAYIDMLIGRDLFDLSIIESLTEKPLDLENINLPTVDLSQKDDMDAVVTQILTGDAAVFVEGYDRAIVVAAKGYPNRGVNTAETETVLLGSKEAFTEAFRINTALVRRRIRDTNMKIKQLRIGRRSKTDVALIYMRDIVRPAVLEELERRIEGIDIDGVTDSGSLEQLIEENWLSPFPQTQLTERPDKAASAILEGRIVVVVDNSPFVMIAPATLNTFFQASEDYYNRWHITSLSRLLRFAAAFLAVALPGFYLSVAAFHPSMLPMLMILKMSAARQEVPFPAIIEILLMDAAFELLREAGIRLPGAAGGTVGIVGGLIIGQSAVEAGLVSPIVVIVIALTGIASFAIPSISLVNGFRLIKYLILLLSSILGFLGFWMGIFLTLTHLASLKSFGVPYLMPFASSELNGGEDRKDTVVRPPLFTLGKRPFFARPGSRVRLKKHQKEHTDAFRKQ